MARWDLRGSGWKLKLSNLNSTPEISDARDLELDVSSWSFIQILNKPSSHHYRLEYKEDDVYIHPSTTKPSSPVMSTRSLEMCTESLGSETGCCFIESMDEMDISRGVQRSKCREFKKRIIKRTMDFPPPLTSISGRERIQVRSHREGGRLVLRAVSILAYDSYFQAERATGTLRLSWKQIGEVENGEEQMANSCRKLTSEIGVPRRCKEKSGSRFKEISNWGQFWVAIS
ncbi:hypothetical protein HAX54_050727 [Datura stramonium]|uniref:FAF domain-containing protein n=1 Tax=Datura stramonium TaxID=4076 RepID=A0ABS8SXJ4_DATST|nr:hypothetical protein [Datura stramonium]